MWSDTPRLTQVTFRKIRGLKSVLSIHVVKCIYICRGVQLKSRLQGTGMWSPPAWPPHFQGCRPSVFFRYLSLMALSCSQGIIRRAFSKCYYLSFFFSVYIYLSAIFNSCRCLPETKRSFSLFLHWSFLNFLLSWLLVLLPSTFSLGVLFSFCPTVSIP